MKSIASLLSLCAIAVTAAFVPEPRSPAAQIDRVVDYKTYVAENNGTFVQGIQERAAQTQGNVYEILRLTFASGVLLIRLGSLVCVAANFFGCVLITNVPNGICVNLGPDLNNFVSSFGPDPNQDCFIYDGFGCTGANRGPIAFPGVATLAHPFTTRDGRPNDPFNDVTSSYQCFNT
ncbi:hypothetical protein VKT23_012359 [Stygiomarasmius scandens]|uniref:Uncharacterized protein n=1 Tax=Marasmiellus scandens TaxID=2682957 RepID=A0ABR1J9X3_9AGAR